jgi:hypothetical protein
MYGLPNDFDAGIFVNQTLDHITFAEYTIHFSFADNISITVSSAFQHLLRADGDPVPAQHVPVSESSLMQLIGHRVTHADSQRDGTLSIVFDDGQVLRVIDDDPHYECYSIHDGKRDIYV